MSEVVNLKLASDQPGITKTEFDAMCSTLCLIRTLLDQLEKRVCEMRLEALEKR